MTDTNPQQAEPLRIPLAHSVRYVARGLPEVPNQYGPGILRPSEITLTYRDSEDSQLGRVHAYVAGRIWVNDMELPLLPGGLYGQHYDDGLDGWPEWLADEARLYDPAAAVSAPVSPAPAELSEAERTMLTYALDQAQERIWSEDGFTDEDQAAVTSLRRLTAEQPASGPGGVAGETPQPETQADLLPAWEAMYEPGNVSDYLIGYANDEAPAKAAAEAWLRSQAEVAGRLEWVPQTPLDGYDQEAELIERHDDGIDTGPGITVRRRVEPAAVSQPDGEA